jgi:ribosome modulation factor
MWSSNQAYRRWVWQQAYRAGLDGIACSSCPFGGAFADVWVSGWLQGARDARPEVRTEAPHQGPVRPASDAVLDVSRAGA